jgi:hypothetical protein
MPFSSPAGNNVARVSAAAVDLSSITGYLVADAQGRVVGRVECPMYGTSPDEPDAVSVRAGA